MVEDVPFARPDVGDREIEAVVEALKSGWLSTGPRATEFERAFSALLGSGLQAMAVNSATAGLHLALEAVGVGPGDEVLVPTWTFTATAEVIRYLGAHPVFVDVDEATLNLDLRRAAHLVTDRTKAVIPVHFAGLPILPEELTAFATRFELAVVEDAAHALPAGSRDALVGSGSSAATVFSFYATKTVTTGEGGMVVTRDGRIADRIRTMRLHGIDRDAFQRYHGSGAQWIYDVIAPGYKYNLPEMAAALGLVQLGRAEQMRQRRAEIAERYLAAFSQLPLRMPEQGDAETLHAWHLFVVRVEDASRISRDDVVAALGARRVGTSVHFRPLHTMTYWRDAYRLDASRFPVAHDAYGRAVSLPIFSAMTDDEVQFVIDQVTQLPW